MKIIEIVAFENGAHRNQTSDIDLVFIPDGWAVVPDEMECENFPFGEVTVEEIDGVTTVTNWVAGVIPEPEPEPKAEPTADDILNAMLGVTV